MRDANRPSIPGDLGRPLGPREPAVLVHDEKVRPVHHPGPLPLHRQFLGHHGGARPRPHRPGPGHPCGPRADADPVGFAVGGRHRAHVLGAPDRGLRPRPRHGLPALPAAHLQHGVRVRADGAADQHLPVPGRGGLESAGYCMFPPPPFFSLSLFLLLVGRSTS